MNLQGKSRLPGCEVDNNKEHPFIMLSTPAFFGGSLLPSNITPTSAAVGKPVALSGWDLSRGGPKPLRFLAPAGSVYFVKKIDDINNSNIGRDTELGFGAFVKGV